VDGGGPLDDGGEDDGETDDDLSDRRPTPVIPAEQRRRMQLWSERLRRGVTAIPAPAVELRMLVLQLHFDLLAAGVWGPDDDEWADQLADVLIATPPTADDHLPKRAEPYVAALVAVGLALLAHGATLHGGRPRDIVLQRAWQAVGDSAADADPELIDHYLYQPSQSFSRVPEWRDIETVIGLARAARENPNAELLAALEVEDLDAELKDGAWVADCGSSPPRRCAARIATLVERYKSAYAVVVRGERGSCVLLCDSGTYALADKQAQVWRVFRQPSPLSTPMTMLAESPPSGERYPRGKGKPVPEKVVQLANSIGVKLERVIAELA